MHASQEMELFHLSHSGQRPSLLLWHLALVTMDTATVANGIYASVTLTYDLAGVRSGFPP